MFDITQRKITKLAREVNKFTIRSLRAEGIGSSELDLIHAIRKNPGSTQAEISQILGIDKSAVARQTASLEKKGYLLRKQNPKDGRSQHLFATAHSEQLKNSKAHVEAVFYNWLITELSADESKEFVRLLDILYLRCKSESKANFLNISKILNEEE